MSYSEALAEAYANVEIEQITLDTLELRHPAFLDENGDLTAVRVVRGFQNYDLRLESDAPMNGGEIVTFVGVPFEFELPSFSEGQVPHLKMTIGNVSRKITQQIELAIAQLKPIDVTYRPYLESDPEAPQMDPPFHMVLTNVSVDVFTISGDASLDDVHNWPFPSKKYTPARFPGLAR